MGARRHSPVCREFNRSTLFTRPLSSIIHFANRVEAFLLHFPASGGLDMCQLSLEIFVLKWSGLYKFLHKDRSSYLRAAVRFSRTNYTCVPKGSRICLSCLHLVGCLSENISLVFARQRTRAAGCREDSPFSSRAIVSGVDGGATEL